MSDDLQKQADQTLAFARYLSWADLQKNLFDAEISREVDAADATALKDHEWRWFGLMSFWYASLNVVIEAWDKLGFSDPTIDRLLAHPNQFRRLLRRYRNAVYHYQQSLLNTRFVELLLTGTGHVYWFLALHDEFVRFFGEHLHRQMVTDTLRAELRESIEGVIHWYPRREPPEIESLERALAHGRVLLGRYSDDGSKARQEFERTQESTEATLREGRKNWATLRAQRLREAGVELNEGS